MGTNYYLHRDVCPHCGRSEERLHIGKSSAGWCFGLHVIPEQSINDLSDWMAEFNKPNAKIVDEYGNPVTPEEMRSQIADRKSTEPWGQKKVRGNFWGYTSWADFHAKNHSEEGPNGLLRHRAGDMGVKHGNGTYDLCPYEFS